MNFEGRRSALFFVILIVFLTLTSRFSWAAKPVPERGTSISADSGTTPQPQEKKKQFFIQGKAYPYDYEFINNSDCLKCHEDKVSPRQFAESAHGADSCNSCHWDITAVAAHVKAVEVKGVEVRTTPVQCSRCHDEEALEFGRSVHLQNGFECTDCHSDIHRLSLEKDTKKQVFQACTSCHDGDDYAASVHGQAALGGNPDAPGCTDCHGVNKSFHNIQAPKGEESKRFHTDACASCHADKKMMERNKVDPLATKTYYEGIHGEIEELGYPKLVAGCSDCHGHHNVLPPDNPKSLISKANVLRTCGKCHHEANTRFVQYIPHLNYGNPRRPAFFWAYMFMHGLLISVFGFFWVHTFLFWRKDFWEKQKLKAKGIHFSPSLRSGEAGQTFLRFSVFDRVLHFLMISSFMMLVLTGLPLEFPSAPWATALMKLFGGSPTRGLIHRVFAVIMSLTFLAAAGYSIYFLFFKRIPGNPGFLRRLFGPDSLFPRGQDFRDLWGMMRWFFDKGNQPTFDRWTYWEKFDFFAVYWGMVIIGISGMVRWFPEFFTKFLPGWIINVAVILHSDEALLAAGFIFTVHFFNNHFRPANFPLNTVIFTGKLPRYKLMDDHTLQYKRLLEDNALKTRQRKYPSVWMDLFSELLGFVMLGIGLLCLILIGWKLLG
jgi:predicted CXXCH cytochrome family protein